MTGNGRSRLLLWLLLALPGAGMLYRWSSIPDLYGYGHIVADTGDWAAWLLMLTLAVTPLRLLFRGWRWPLWLARHRRDFGVASFAYAAGHTAIYLTDKPGVRMIIEEAATPGMLAGWLAFALFLPLALTSNDRAVRALRKSWKRLHRLVYPAAVLTFAHWVLAAFDPTTAWMHIGFLAAIEIVRIALQRRQRVT